MNEWWRGIEEVGIRRTVGKVQLSTWPSSSLHISCLLSFFKGNLFLDISKTHLKAIFTPWLQPSPLASSLYASHIPLSCGTRCVAEPVSWHQHSFDLILRAICNPLQDTEARSPTQPHHYISLFICLSFQFLSQDLTFSFFFTISSPPLPIHPPTPRLIHPSVGLSVHLIHAGIMGLQRTKDLPHKFTETDMKLRGTTTDVQFVFNRLCLVVVISA